MDVEEPVARLHRAVVRLSEMTASLVCGKTAVLTNKGPEDVNYN
jgi:hypothetical protein